MDESFTTDTYEVPRYSLRVNGDPSKLYENLAKAQAEFLPVPEDAKGQVGNNRNFKYADFATIIRCIRPALAKYGIAFLQPLHTEGHYAVTTTILAGHGASLEASLRFLHDKNPQEFGRIHTYHRRYQLLGFFAIEGEDAEEARKETEKRQYSEPAPKSEPKNEAPKAVPKDAPVGTASTATVAATPPTQKTNGNGNGTPKPPVAIDANVMNDMLDKGRKQLGWEMKDIRAFYIEHLDPSFTGKLVNLPLTAKRALHAKLVELKGVEPF